MCGIVGFQGGISEEDLQFANMLQSHRGPDDAGFFYDKNSGIGLAHTRLSIQDLSLNGHQPMYSHDGLVVIVFNGEIYNFSSLRASLEKSGFTFRGESDTEVLLAMYLRDGSNMLSQLNGIFSFAVWDGRVGELLIARDALGVKPLYVVTDNVGFCFASELKALLYLRPDLRALDGIALHQYLSFLWSPGNATPIKGIRKLSPGEALTISNGKVKKQWQWYSLPFFRNSTDYVSEQEAISGVQETLRNAVYRQLVSDVPVGAFLSGGLDSSAIVAMAREKNSSLRCYTIDAKIQSEGLSNDLPYAKRVASHLGLPLEIVEAEAKNMVNDLEKMVYMLDEPLADPAPLNVLYISRLARSQGVRVLLSGAGGDDVFTGYRRHLALNYEHMWSWMPISFRKKIERYTSNLNQNVPSFRRLRKLFDGVGLDGDERIINYFLWQREEKLYDLYTDDFRSDLIGYSAMQPMRDYMRSMPKSVKSIERMLALEQRFFLADHNLSYTDKMSMACGVEVRVPFLDTDLIEFAARIHPNLKQKGSVGKWVLKKAMEDYLPSDVIYRKKSGFGAPVRTWMRYELKDMQYELLSEDSLKKRGIFNPIAVKKLIEGNLSGRIDAAYTLLSLMCIELWCRMFIDRKLSYESAHTFYYQ